jgi:hypothetical protein
VNPPDLSVTQARIDANWQAITVELDAPRPGRIERLLARVGVPSWTARLLVATPGLRRAWFVAMAVVIVVGLGAVDAADPRNGLFTWLVLAPLLPVLGVAMAYGPDSDPAHEITLATPLRGLRLVLIRSAAVIALSVVVLGLVSLLTPELSLMAAGWLVPALACTSVTLAAMTFVAPRHAAAITAVGWLLVVLVARRAAEDPLAAFTAVGQAAAAAVCIVGLIVVWMRRDRFDVLATSAVTA